MKRLISLRALQAFEAFGRHGSVAAAADELGVTSGAVSQQIRLAEAQLGTNLLTRRGKYVALSKTGRHYHATVSRAFELLRQAQDDFFQARAKSKLTLSCHPSMASRWLGPLLFDWQSTYPEANIHLVGPGNEPQDQEEEVDFRVSYGDRRHQLEKSSHLFDDWVLPACSPALWTDLGISKPADILAQPLLWIEWEQYYEQPPSWDDWARSIGADLPERSRRLTFAVSSAAIDSAINNRGFVLAQKSMIWDDVRSGRLVVPFDLPLKMPQPYFLTWRAAALKKPFGVELRSWLCEMGRRQSRMSMSDQV